MDAAQSIKLKYELVKIVSRVSDTRISGECVLPTSVNFACKVCIHNSELNQAKIEIGKSAISR